MITTIQITLVVEGNEADAIRAVDKALDNGVFQNAILEHDLEDGEPLALISINRTRSSSIFQTEKST